MRLAIGSFISAAVARASAARLRQCAGSSRSDICSAPNRSVRQPADSRSHQLEPQFSLSGGQPLDFLPPAVMVDAIVFSGMASDWPHGLRQMQDLSVDTVDLINNLLSVQSAASRACSRMSVTRQEPRTLTIFDGRDARRAHEDGLRCSEPKKDLGAPLSKLAAGERPIKRVAKFLNAERLMEKLQAVIGSVPHNRIVAGNHNQWKSKRFGVFGE